MQSPRNGVILVTMDAILKALTETPSLNTLPLRVEEGCLPALITQVGGAMRAICAAMLHKSTGRPLAVICPDDASARTLAGDLTALLGRAPVIPVHSFSSAEFISRGGRIPAPLNSLKN